MSRTYMKIDQIRLWGSQFQGKSIDA